jgi:hypothetical protein
MTTEMTGKKRWYAARGHPRGLSTGVGMVGGLILVTTGLTAGLAAAQLVRVHAALVQAAHAAAQSEQQQGCWTESTTQAVYETLKGAGINPGTVRLTADTASSTAYGGAVTAGLATTVGISVLGAKLMHIPIAAGANATSFYTPATANSSNPSCVTPATCPTTVVEHQVCQNVTTQDCTPVSQQVCGPVTQTQCGYTTEDEYTCHPVQRCTPVTSEVCTPIWGEQCGSWSGGTYTPWGYCITTHSESCTTQTSESCSTTDVCGYSPVTSYSCHDVTTTECRTETTQSCHPVTQEQCTTVPETVSACG